jgi:hypothetical protein
MTILNYTQAQNNEIFLTKPCQLYIISQSVLEGIV